MLFVEPIFFLFFAVTLLVYWGLVRNGARKTFLLLASYVFYGAWDWRFAFLLLFISLADYAFARQIAREENPARRKMFVVLSLAMNLGVLGFFKYCQFFVDSTVRLAGAFGLTLDHPTLHILLPVGISFITFQSLSYTIDVYRGQLKPARSLRDYLMFAAFFPQLVAGPIVRPAYFLPQLVEKRAVNTAQVKASLLLFLLGFVKKTGIADNIAPYVDQIFAAPQGYDALAVMSAAWLYAAQIYCDFSGYSDMAIAVAGLLGYKLTLNFNAPYLATSIQEFWRRWHISLSTWIRDYIYISLGGRDAKRWKTHRNLLLTMLAGGLWHGAAWSFVAWGGLHGLALVAQREWQRRVRKSEAKGQLGQLFGWFVTINFVCMAWIFFRATDFASGWLMLQRYLWLNTSGALALPWALTLLPPALLLFECTARRFACYDRLAVLGAWRFAMLYGAAWALALALLPLGNRPFIYFQF